MLTTGKVGKQMPELSGLENEPSSLGNRWMMLITVQKSLLSDRCPVQLKDWTESSYNGLPRIIIQIQQGHRKLCEYQSDFLEPIHTRVHWTISFLFALYISCPESQRPTAPICKVRKEMKIECFTALVRKQTLKTEIKKTGLNLQRESLKIKVSGKSPCISLHSITAV